MASKPIRGFVLASQDLAKIGQKYLCNSCTYVLRNPVQTECGHHYCRQCLDYLLRKSNAAKCLKDGTPLTEASVFSDTCIAREVLSFTVHCVYVEDGCAWIGEIRVLERHLEDCPYVRVPCIIPSCGVLVKRNSLAFHLENECSERVVKCSYCELSLSFSELKAHETTNCKLFPETCGLCMKTNIPREELKFHYDECDEVEIECAFAPIGCKEKKKMKKGEREAHMSLFTCFHLTLLLRIVLFIKDQIQWVLNQLKSLSDELATLMRLKETVTEMMSQIAALVISNTEIREELKSQETRTKSLETSLTKQSGGEVIGGEVISGEVIRRRLRNYTGDMADDFTLLKRDFERLLQSNEIMQTTIRQLQQELQSQNQVVGLSSVNMTELEQNLCRLESTSYEGILLWKIKGFAQKRREAINGVNTSFYSPFFYTSRYGYKMCARIYLNGDGMGKGTHISLFFVIARGEYDALLRWPFRQKVTMMILDQNCMEHMIDAFRPDPASSSFQRPSKEMNIASGCPLFCPLDDLNKHGYVRDDCMFVKIIVDTTDY